MKKRSYFLTAFLLFAGIFNTWAYDGDGSAATPYQIKTVVNRYVLKNDYHGLVSFIIFMAIVYFIGLFRKVL